MNGNYTSQKVANRSFIVPELEQVNTSKVHCLYSWNTWSEVQVARKEGNKENLGAETGGVQLKCSHAKNETLWNREMAGLHR